VRWPWRVQQPDPADPVWLLRFADERGDFVNGSHLTTGTTLAQVREHQAAGYWPDGRPGAWSPSHPDVWCWAEAEAGKRA